jgi:hypothetical protein
MHALESWTAKVEPAYVALAPDFRVIPNAVTFGQHSDVKKWFSIKM